MPHLKIYKYKNDTLEFMPIMEKDKLIDLMMYLHPDNKNKEHYEEYHFIFTYEEIFLMRNYFSSVIDLFDKKS